jgi:hypothetical protein
MGKPWRKVKALANQRKRWEASQEPYVPSGNKGIKSSQVLTSPQNQLRSPKPNLLATSLDHPQSYKKKPSALQPWDKGYDIKIRFIPGAG